MYESIKLSLQSWNATTTEREKLQHLYVVASVLLLVVAGVIGLLNQNLGQQILAVAIVSAMLFLVNAVAWALLQSFILFRLAKPGRKVTPKKK
ncbi:MAG: hypothetical protein WAS27_04205 [Candidatus Saccharimonadales bacterium]